MKQQKFKITPTFKVFLEQERFSKSDKSILIRIHNTVYQSYFFKSNKGKEFKDISREVFIESCGYRYLELLNVMIEEGIIERDNFYSAPGYGKENKTKSYKFTFPYNPFLVKESLEISLPKCTSTKEYYKTYKKVNTLKYLKEIKGIDSLSRQRIKQVKVLKENRFIFTEHLEELNNLVVKTFNPKDRFGFRYHSVITGLESSNMKYIRDEEGRGLWEIDAAAMQPTLLANLSTETIKRLLPNNYKWFKEIKKDVERIINTPNFKFFQELVFTKDLYQEIADRLNIQPNLDEETSPRNLSKSYFLSGLYSRCNTFQCRSAATPFEIVEKLNLMFPSIIELKKVFNSIEFRGKIERGIKENKNKKAEYLNCDKTKTFLCALLQRLESSLFVDHFTKILTHNNINSLTKHDSILFSQFYNVKEVVEVFKQFCNSINFTISFHCKDLLTGNIVDTSTSDTNTTTLSIPGFYNRYFPSQQQDVSCSMRHAICQEFFPKKSSTTHTIRKEEKIQKSDLFCSILPKSDSQFNENNIVELFKGSIRVNDHTAKNIITSYNFIEYVNSASLKQEDDRFKFREVFKRYVKENKIYVPNGVL